MAEEPRMLNKHELREILSRLDEISLTVRSLRAFTNKDDTPNVNQLDNLYVDIPVTGLTRSLTSMRTGIESLMERRKDKTSSDSGCVLKSRTETELLQSLTRLYTLHGQMNPTTAAIAEQLVKFKVDVSSRSIPVRSDMREASTGGSGGNNSSSSKPTELGAQTRTDSADSPQAPLNSGELMNALIRADTIELMVNTIARVANVSYSIDGTFDDVENSHSIEPLRPWIHTLKRATNHLQRNTKAELEAKLQEEARTERLGKAPHNYGGCVETGQKCVKLAESLLASMTHLENVRGFQAPTALALMHELVRSREPDTPREGAETPNEDKTTQPEEPVAAWTPSSEIPGPPSDSEDLSDSEHSLPRGPPSVGAAWGEFPRPCGWDEFGPPAPTPALSPSPSLDQERRISPTGTIRQDDVMLDDETRGAAVSARINRTFPPVAPVRDALPLPLVSHIDSPVSYTPGVRRMEAARRMLGNAVNREHIAYQRTAPRPPHPDPRTEESSSEESMPTPKPGAVEWFRSKAAMEWKKYIEDDMKGTGRGENESRESYQLRGKMLRSRMCDIHNCDAHGYRTHLSNRRFTSPEIFHSRHLPQGFKMSRYTADYFLEEEHAVENAGFKPTQIGEEVEYFSPMNGGLWIETLVSKIHTVDGEQVYDLVRSLDEQPFMKEVSHVMLREPCTDYRSPTVSDKVNATIRAHYVTMQHQEQTAIDSLRWNIQEEKEYVRTKAESRGADNPVPQYEKTIDRLRIQKLEEDMRRHVITRDSVASVIFTLARQTADSRTPSVWPDLWRPGGEDDQLEYPFGRGTITSDVTRLEKMMMKNLLESSQLENRDGKTTTCERCKTICRRSYHSNMAICRCWQAATEDVTDFRTGQEGTRRWFRQWAAPSVVTTDDAGENSDKDVGMDTTEEPNEAVEP